MNLKSYKNKKTWILSLNLSYADDIARLAYVIFAENNIIPKLASFPIVINNIKKELYSQNISKKVICENPFKLIIKRKSHIDEIIIVAPSYLSIFFILFLRIRNINVTSIIHNHPNFKADNSFLKLILGKIIELFSIILSNNVIFTSPHIKRKWAITKTFRFLKLSHKSTSFKSLFSFKEASKKNKYLKTFSHQNIYQRKVIDIYSWGRSTPYKDISILHKIFHESEILLDPALSLNIIHYGITSSSKPFFLHYENSVSKISIINKRVSFDELKNIHLDADYIIFPYTDMSQSGPLRYSCELGSSILVPKMDGSVDQLFNYEDKFLFNINDLQTLFVYFNQKHA